MGFLVFLFNLFFLVFNDSASRPIKSVSCDVCLCVDMSVPSSTLRRKPLEVLTKGSPLKSGFLLDSVQNVQK